MRTHIRFSLMATTALMVVAQPASAQTQPQADPVPAPATAAPEPATPDKDIIVTGSRVITNGNKSPTPLTVVTADSLLTAQPTGVVQGLTNLPGLMGSYSAATANSNSGGGNYLNLRGVGTTRALVLFDGRRLGPTAASGDVDVGIIPQMLLQRVDVVTGGASAVYGSDAVSGVVNFIPDTTFVGFKALAQNGLSSYGDDRKTKLSAAWGTKLGDHGHFEIGYEFNNQTGLLRSDRPYLSRNASEEGSVPGSTASAGSAANPNQLMTNVRLSGSSFGGLINTGPLAGLQFAQNGALSTFNHGTKTGTSGVEIGGDGSYYTGSTALIPRNSHQAFTRFDYDVSDTIKFYAEGAFTYYVQDYYQQNLLLSNLAVGYNNAFLSSIQPQYQAVVASQLAANPNGSFNFSKMDTAIAPYHDRDSETYLMGVLGFKGKTSAFDWDVSYAHTDSAYKQVTLNNTNAGKLYASLNSVVNPANGQTVCRAALTNAAYAGCVPFNAFGPTSDNLAATNYFTQTTTGLTHYALNDVTGTISGALFSLPAGPVKAALNGEWRRQTTNATSDAQPTDVVNCAGIQFNCNASTAPFLSRMFTSENQVSQVVKEIAGEANAPLLADKPFFKSLSIDGAVRWTNYNTSGTAWTWKGGAVWQVSSDITFRGARSRDIRAPNLTDLFAPPSYRLRNYADLLTATSGSVYSVTTSNPNLTPEKADTLTLGVVLSPQAIPGFSLSVDYYNINIKNAIVGIDGFQPGTQQACNASGGTAPVCSLYVRPLGPTNTSAANYPTLLYTAKFNAAAVVAKGLDVEMNYKRRIGADTLTLRGLVTYEPVLRFDNGPSGVVNQSGAVDGNGAVPSIPTWRVVGTATWSFHDRFDVLVRERWRSSLKPNSTPGLYYLDPDLPSLGYTDINLTAKINSQFEAFFNIQNLFNANPPTFSSAGGSTQPNFLGGFAQGDDFEGRYMTVGVRIKI